MEKFFKGHMNVLIPLFIEILVAVFWPLSFEFTVAILVVTVLLYVVSLNLDLFKKFSLVKKIKNGIEKRNIQLEVFNWIILIVFIYLIYHFISTFIKGEEVEVGKEIIRDWYYLLYSLIISLIVVWGYKNIPNENPVQFGVLTILGRLTNYTLSEGYNWVLPVIFGLKLLPQSKIEKDIVTDKPRTKDMANIRLTASMTLTIDQKNPKKYMLVLLTEIVGALQNKSEAAGISWAGSIDTFEEARTAGREYLKIYTEIIVGRHVSDIEFASLMAGTASIYLGAYGVTLSRVTITIDPFGPVVEASQKVEVAKKTKIERDIESSTDASTAEKIFEVMLRYNPKAKYETALTFSQLSNMAEKGNQDATKALGNLQVSKEWIEFGGNAISAISFAMAEILNKKNTTSGNSISYTISSTKK